MKIRFFEDTNIRITPRLAGNVPVGVMFKGSEIDVEPDMVRGDSIQGIDSWYHDKNGWYYWSGMAEKIVEEVHAPINNPSSGIIFSPAPSPETTEETGTPGIPVLTPPLANDDAILGNEAIPEGETRLVPSLEVLLEKERRGSTGSGTLPKPTRELESTAAEPEVLMESRGIGPKMASRDIETPPSSQHEPVSEAPKAPALWQNPTPQKLNWGVQNYLIARDWWLSRRLTGRGISIAILSTGADPAHPDLVNFAGRYPESNSLIVDLHGLGTQAAVVAAGCGQTVFGVAPEARLLIGKLGDQDHLITADRLIAGLRWAIDARADVVAMLVDLPDMGEQLEELQILVNRAIELNILLVAPAGTSENKKPESRYPAQLASVLSVGAHDQYGQRCGFSARSYDLDLLAPGEGLLTSTPTRQPVTNLKSTSIAAAFVAGFLALIRQWQRENNLATTPAMIFSMLCETAASRRPFNKGEDVEYGHGILNPIEVLKRLNSTYQGPDQV